MVSPLHIQKTLQRVAVPGSLLRGKKQPAKEASSLKESLAFLIAGQPLENTALVSTHKTAIKLLQMAFILTGQE